LTQISLIFHTLGMHLQVVLARAMVTGSESEIQPAA
jgi:hypothetical protein